LILFGVKKDISQARQLSVTGIVKEFSIRALFMNTSVKDYFSGENTIKEELLEPYENLVIHTKLIIQFYISFVDGKGKIGLHVRV
jgi:hypothetical protein